MKRKLKDSIEEHAFSITVGAAIATTIFVITATAWAVNAWRDLKEENSELRKTTAWHTQALRNLHQTKPKEAAVTP